MPNFGGVLILAQDPEVLRNAKSWLTALDVQGKETGEQIYVYFAQNSLAVDIGNVLTQVYGLAGPSGGEWGKESCSPPGKGRSEGQAVLVLALPGLVPPVPAPPVLALPVRDLPASEPSSGSSGFGSSGLGSSGIGLRVLDLRVLGLRGLGFPVQASFGSSGELWGLIDRSVLLR